MKCHDSLFLVDSTNLICIDERPVTLECSRFERSKRMTQKGLFLSHSTKADNIKSTSYVSLLPLSMGHC